MVKNVRDVAQLGSASVLGTEGRRFKSCHPDKLLYKTHLPLWRYFEDNSRETKPNTRQADD